MDASKVLRVVLEPGAGRVEELEALAGRLELEPDAERVQAIQETLAEAWQSVEGRAA